MTDIPLRDALQALKAKINAVSAAKETTAEDLAMLGTAIEKIAGRVSVVEFELIAQNLTQQLQTLAAQKLSEVNTVSDSAVDQIEDLVEATNTNLINLVNTKEAEFNDNATSKTTAFNSNATEKQTAFNTNATAKQTGFNNNASTKQASFDANIAASTAAGLELVRESAASVVFTNTFKASSITRNLNGLVTRWDTGDGLVYSDITYDSQQRIRSWTETLDRGSGTSITYNFIASYNPTTGALSLLDRTLVE